MVQPLKKWKKFWLKSIASSEFVSAQALHLLRGWKCSWDHSASVGWIPLPVCVGSLAAYGDGEQTEVYWYCFIIHVFFDLLTFAKGIGLKLFARSCQCSRCVLHALSFRDWLSTWPNFSAALQAVLVLKKYASISQKKSGAEVFNHLKKKSVPYDSWQPAVKEVSGHRGESWTTSHICDARADMFKRTTAQQWVSLLWSWARQPATSSSSSNLFVKRGFARCCPTAPDSLPEREQSAHLMKMPEICLWLRAQIG